MLPKPTAKNYLNHMLGPSAIKEEQIAHLEKVLGEKARAGTRFTVRPGTTVQIVDCGIVDGVRKWRLKKVDA